MLLGVEFAASDIDELAETDAKSQEIPVFWQRLNAYQYITFVDRSASCVLSFPDP